MRSALQPPPPALEAALEEGPFGPVLPHAARKNVTTQNETNFTHAAAERTETTSDPPLVFAVSTHENG